MLTVLLFFSFLQNSDQENEQRRRLEQAAALAASKRNDDVQLRNRPSTKKQQVGSCDLRLSTAFLLNFNQLNSELMQRMHINH